IHPIPHSFPSRRSTDLTFLTISAFSALPIASPFMRASAYSRAQICALRRGKCSNSPGDPSAFCGTKLSLHSSARRECRQDPAQRSEEQTSELQSLDHLV